MVLLELLGGNSYRAVRLRRHDNLDIRHDTQRRERQNSEQTSAQSRCLL
jgi:hypothetical protein